MYEKIRDYARAHGMLDKGDVVIAGISGGADSVCLLCVLLELKKEYDLEVRAVHVNHGIRGAAAAADEAYVEELCQRWEFLWRASMWMCAGWPGGGADPGGGRARGQAAGL